MLLARPIPVLAAVTLPSNDVMIHVLQKAGLIDCGEVPDGGMFKRMFATSSLRWSPPRTEDAGDHDASDGMTRIAAFMI
ncbi:MAG: hypothetical protein Q6373_004815 [Candidatus Sigynarchaeota archaeon]